MNAVKDYFRSIFSKCRLNKISYDEKYSVDLIPEMHLGYLKSNQVMIMGISFDGEVWEGKYETDDFRIGALTRSENLSGWGVVSCGYL